MPTGTLPEIPVVDVGDGGPLALVRRQRAKALALIDSARRAYTPPGVALADRQSRRWLERSENPYRAEIAAIAGELGVSGVTGLNVSYEWACTSGVSADPGHPGCRLLRTLDWPLHGLGRNLVVARQSSAAGPWLNITWPGFAGVMTAMAPGRFAAAINQPPIRRVTGFVPLDWVVQRIRVGRSRALPPSHLLRRAFETCHAYGAAKTMLMEGEICVPAIYSLTGIRPDETCIIERTETAAITHDGPAAAANNWLTTRLGPGGRGIASRARKLQMDAWLAAARGTNPVTEDLVPEDLVPESGDLEWLQPPVLNRYTRLAVEANADQGRLAVQGWEAVGPATKVLRLQGLA